MSNPPGLVSLIVLSLSMIVSGCASVQHVGTSNMHQLKNLSYQGVHGQTVELKDGVYEGPTFDASGASRLRVALIEQLMVSGDMTGDGHDEAAVFLTASSSGSGRYTYLAIVTKSGYSYQNIATANLGDRIQIRALRFAGGTLILDFVTAGPEDASCCPSMNMRNTYRLVNGELRQITDKAVGPLSLRDLQGTKWTLAEIAGNEPVPREVPVYALIEDKRLSGSSGCNRYFSDITGDGPYDIKIGPVGATRMMCAEPMMQVEDRYLAAMQKVSQFGFFFGQLVLGYEDDNKPQRLLFNPGPAEIPE